jgi:HK97 family phage major capsid protein
MAGRVAIPTKPEELEAFMLDTAKLRDAQDSGQWPDVLRAYVDKVMNDDGEMREQIRNQTIATVRELYANDPNAKLDRLPLGHPAGYDSADVRNEVARKHGLRNPDAPGATLDGIFKSQAQFFRALSPKLQNYRNAKELAEGIDTARERIQASFSTNAPSDGGFLIPEQFRSDMLMLALEDSIVQPRATVIPMETQRTLIPTVDSTTNATSVFGGIVCYWVDEATAPTESSAKFGQVVLDTKKLMAYCTAPNELVADATAFEAFLRQALPRAMAFERDYRFMVGTGAGEPLGFVNSAASVQVSAVSGQGASTIVVENLASMYSRMLPSSLNSAVWIASIDTFPQLATMALSVGTGGAPVWLAGGGVADGPPVTIYGRPVIFTEKTPALGTTGDINFVDLSFYLIGDRQMMDVTSSTDFLFSSDRIAYKIVQRVDGRPWLQSAITPKNGSSNTLTPFVQLSSTRT